MSQATISTLLNLWLVVASSLFIVIVYRTFRPSQAAAMDRHSRIPFDNEEGLDVVD